MIKNGLALAMMKKLTAWARSDALSAMPLESGCCAQSFFAGGVYGLQNAGLEPVFNPRHADVLIVTGAMSNKLVPVVRTIYEQMPFPKSVVAVGACACGGGIFNENYAVLADLTTVLPVDVFVPGCPPSLSAFKRAVMVLEEKIARKTREGTW